MRKMSTYTVATLPRLSSTELSKAILENASSNLDAQTPPAKLAIVDVRDDGLLALSSDYFLISAELQTGPPTVSTSRSIQSN